MPLLARRLLPVISVLFLGQVATSSEPLPPPRSAPSISAAEIKKLIAQLGDNKFHTREWASQHLTMIGKPALPALREAAQSMDAEVASRAQRIVADIQSSVPYLLEGLKDTHAAARKDAAAGLERLGTKAKGALPALVAALQDKDESVREAAVGAVLAIDPLQPALAALVPAKAHVNGKYVRLLRRIKVAEDRQSYSDFRDFGYYQACDWAGFTNLPAGYWVYVYPHWYIWAQEKADK